MRPEDQVRETPNTVVTTVALGSAPVPFLGVYAIIFIVHGGFHPVIPPDITSTNRGELFAGIIALVMFVIAVITLFWMLNGTRRWPLVIVQLAVLGTAIDFLLDSTKGGPIVSLLLAVTSVVTLGFAFAPASWAYLGRERPHRRKRARPPETELAETASGA